MFTFHRSPLQGYGSSRQRAIRADLIWFTGGCIMRSTICTNHQFRLLPALKYATGFLVGILSLLCATSITLAAPAGQDCTSVTCVTTGPQLTTIDSTQSELLDALLGNLLGADLQLSAANWQGLAQGTIGLDDLLNELQGDLNVATPAAVLTSDIQLRELLNAAIAVAQANGDLAAVNGLTLLLDDVDELTGQLQLGDLLAVDLADGAAATSQLNLLDLMTGAIQLFNYNNVLTTSAPVTVSGGELGLQGILNAVTLQAQVVEPPTYACGGVNTQFYAAAVRLKLTVDLVDTTLDLDQLALTLATLLEPTLGQVAVDLTATVGQFDLYATVARGQGVITLVDAVAAAVTVNARPGVVDLYLGVIDEALFFQRSHVITPTLDLQSGTIGTLAITVTTGVGTPVDITVDLQARSFAQGEDPIVQSLAFTGPYPATQIAGSSSATISTLLSQLLTNLELNLAGSVGGIMDPLVAGNLLPALTTATANTIEPIIAPILREVIDPLLSELGIGLGEMSVTVNLVEESCADPDEDGIPTSAEDLNGNGDPSDDDTDGDGTPNYLDPDDDGDTVPTINEDPNDNGNPRDDDTDGDGMPNYLDPDDDGDTVLTRNEDPNGNGNPRDDDTDGDGTPNYLDPDDDGDLVPTRDEDRNENGDPRDDDTDRDGLPNYLDADDDGDGTPTREEDTNANGNLEDDDDDNDNIPDYLDSDPVIRNLNQRIYLPLIIEQSS